jgi:hypothetical protein
MRHHAIQNAYDRSTSFSKTGQDSKNSKTPCRNNFRKRCRNPSRITELDTRLQFIGAKTGEDLQRLRRKVAFDRFLARIFSRGNPGFYLKGGYAMELRIAQARATRDLDLTCIYRVLQSFDQSLWKLALF